MSMEAETLVINGGKGDQRVVLGSGVGGKGANVVGSGVA